MRRHERNGIQRLNRTSESSQQSFFAAMVSLAQQHIACFADARSSPWLCEGNSCAEPTVSISQVNKPAIADCADNADVKWPATLNND